MVIGLPHPRIVGDRPTPHPSIVGSLPPHTPVSLVFGLSHPRIAGKSPSPLPAIRGCELSDLHFHRSHPRIVGSWFTNDTRVSKHFSGLLSPMPPYRVGKACPLAPPHRWCSVSRTPTPLVKRVLIPYAADTQMVCTEQTDIEGHDLGLCPSTPLCSVTHLQSREGSRVLELGILSRIPVRSVRVVQSRRTLDGADIGFYH